MTRVTPSQMGLLVSVGILVMILVAGNDLLPRLIRIIQEAL